MKVDAPLLAAKQILKGLNVLRVFKLLSTRKTSRLFQIYKRSASHLETRYGIRFPRILSKLFWLAFLTIVLSHWMGCIQFMVVRLHGFPEESWVVQSGLLEENPDVQWCWALFKALSQLLLIGFETPP